MGWLNAILPTEGFVDHALNWAARLAERSGAALIAAKKSLRDSSRLPFSDAITREREIFLRHFVVSDLAAEQGS